MTLARIEPTEVGLSAAQTVQDLEASFALAVRQRELLAEYIKTRLIRGKHTYKVPGTDREGLTKDGAELICLPHGLKPEYTQNAGPSEPPSDGSPFQITVTCRLMKGGSFGGEGMGSASSYITKTDGTYQPRQRDPGLCHNATLKMAQKSAYIAATLNATAASEFYTQDMDDATDNAESQTAERGSCPTHKVAFEHRQGVSKNGKPYDFWACPEKATDGGYCQARPAEPPAAVKTALPAPQAPPATPSAAAELFPAAGPSPATDPFAVPELKNRGQVRAYADLLDIKGQNLWVALRITKIEEIDDIGPQEAGRRLRAFFDAKRARLETERDSARR